MPASVAARLAGVRADSSFFITSFFYYLDDVNNKQQLRHPFIRLRREGSNETRLSLVDLLLDFRALLSPSCGASSLQTTLCGLYTDHVTYASSTIGR